MNNKIPTSKIIKFGKGVAIIIPEWYMKEKNIKVGDEIYFQIWKTNEKRHYVPQLEK